MESEDAGSMVAPHIEDEKKTLAQRIMNLQAKNQPEIHAYSAFQWKFAIEDMIHNLDHLAITLRLGIKEIFFHYISGLRSILESRKIIAISAALYNHLFDVVDLIYDIRSNYPGTAKILGGGRLSNEISGLWQKVGADFFSQDPTEAILFASENIRTVK